METCIDDVLRALPSPPACAPSAPPPSAAPPDGAEDGAVGVSVDEPLSLSEAAARLKQLELESAALPLTPKNVNLNVAMNNQELVKLTEKAVLSNSGSSPLLTPLRTPDLKSNILKAQAQAAACKVFVPQASQEELTLLSDKNCNLQDSATRLKVHSGHMGSNSSLSVRAEVQELKAPSAGDSVEHLSEDLSLCVPLELSTETLPPQVCPEEVELCVSAPVPENLIDFSDLAPAVPPVQAKPPITPRWIVPSSAPPGIFSNGVSEPEPKSAPVCSEAALPLSQSSSSSVQPPSDASKPRGLVTTQL